MDDAKTQWSDVTDEQFRARFMYELFANGVIGTKEFRSWLAKTDTVFAEVRDADVDNEIDRLARERAENLRNLQAREQEEQQPEGQS